MIIETRSPLTTPHMHMNQSLLCIKCKLYLKPYLKIVFQFEVKEKYCAIMANGQFLQLLHHSAHQSSLVEHCIWQNLQNLKVTMMNSCEFNILVNIKWFELHLVT